MNNSMISAMVSMSGIQQRLDLLADNMANLNTVGFKRKEATFEDTLTRVQQQAKGMELPGRVSPSGFNLGFGSMMAGAEVNFEQGPIKQTDIPTDLAIEGNALFSVMTAGNIKAYTRAGNFMIQPDPNDAESAWLVTNDGHYLLNTDGERIVVPANSKLQIDEHGWITAVAGSGAAEQIGRIQLYTPIRTDALQKRDGNLFVIAPGAQEADVLANTFALPQDQQARLRQGALESSNVNLTDEMAELMQVQRAYQLSARALTSSDTMMNLANNLRG